MLSIMPTDKSPKIIIDFTTLLFEVSGSSILDEAVLFYKPIFEYIYENFYQVANSIYHYQSVSLTLHFYLREIGEQDLQMIRKIDDLFFKIQEFKTYIYWYYDYNNPNAHKIAEEVQQTFKNNVRLIGNSVHT